MGGRLYILVLGDLLLSCLSVYSGFFLRFAEAPGTEAVFSMGGARLAVFAFILAFSSFLLELYSSDGSTSKKEVFARVLSAIFISFFMLSAIYYIAPQLVIGRGVLALSLSSFALFQFAWHVSYKFSLKLPRFARRVLILGTGPLANQMGAIVNSVSHNYVLTGYVNCTNETVLVPPHNIVGNGEGLAETAHREKAHKIVVSLSERRGAFPLKDVLSCKLGGIEIVDAPSFYEQVTGKLLIENITPSWFIFSDGFRITATKMLFKRIFDVGLAVTGLLVAAPLVPFVVLAIKFDSKGPVLYRQVRMGQREKNFVLYKFRTMRTDAETETGAVWAEKNDPRITRIGRFLRKSRLDEIPQLYNVLRGDMSMVGPRPERPEFIEKLKEIIPYYSERHFVKPGITGWAQVKYPYGASVEDAVEKLRYDLFYIKHFSPPLDVLILLETTKVILFGRGGR